MKQLLAGVLLLLASALAYAATPAADLFAQARYQNIKLSPDGKHIALTYEQGSEVQLAVMNLATKAITHRFRYGDEMHVVWFDWANDERVLMMVQRVTGNLDNRGRRAQLFAANIDGTQRRQLQDFGTRILSLLKDDPKHILISKKHPSDVAPHIFKLNVYTGDERYLSIHPTPVNQYGDGGMSYIADNAGNVRVALESIAGDSVDDYEFIIHVREDERWRKLNLKSVRKVVNFSPLGFSADNSKAYFTSNHDMAKDDRDGVFEYDFSTTRLRLIYRHHDVDVSSALYGHDDDVLGVRLLNGLPEDVYFADKSKDSAFMRALAQAFPGQATRVTSYSRNGELAIAYVGSDRNPGDFYLFDIKSMKASYLASTRPVLKPEDMMAMEPVIIEARDGTKLHALLTRPKNATGKLPLIVNVHGGPFGVTDFWGFNPEAQFFAQRGYAWLQVNYRGSGNRGQDFMNAGRRGWGGVMQDDVTDATHWAVKQGIADPARMCIYGGSYGGYAALAGVIKEPDLYKCSVGYVGVFDMLWFRSGDGADSDGAGDKYADMWKSAYIGDDEAQLRSVSPVHNVDKIKAALLLVHGSKDVRVPIGHFDRLRAALDKINYPYEWMVKPEGHGFYQVENRVALYTKMLEFFEKHIGVAKESAVGQN